jgi:hypothetical protein
LQRGKPFIYGPSANDAKLTRFETAWGIMRAMDRPTLTVGIGIKEVIDIAKHVITLASGTIALVGAFFEKTVLRGPSLVTAICGVLLLLTMASLFVAIWSAVGLFWLLPEHVHAEDHHGSIDLSEGRKKLRLCVAFLQLECSHWARTAWSLWRLLGGKRSGTGGGPKLTVSETREFALVLPVLPGS